jgi:hypothetical protein
MLPPIVILLSAAPTAWADIQDYEFRLVQRSARPGEETVLAVKLVHKTTGNAIPDAIIFGRRLDMAPAGMPTMTADLEPLPSNEPGVYQFKTILAMEGNWQFSLAAKIQGETGTLLNRLVLEATN